MIFSDRLLAIPDRIKVYQSRKWQLRLVTVRADAGGVVQISWDHCHSGEDARTKGPFVIDHRVDPRNFDAVRKEFVPASKASPVKLLDR